MGQRLNLEPEYSIISVDVWFIDESDFGRRDTFCILESPN
jgi:hypothetical protein